jgi:hypothetical protein
MLLAQVWKHWELNWIFLPNQFFAIFLNFQQQNPLKINNIFHILALKIMKYTLLNLTGWVAYNITNNDPKFQYSF